VPAAAPVPEPSPPKVAAPPRPAPAAASAPPLPDAAEGSAHVPDAAAEPAASPADSAKPKGGDASFDELAFLQSVTDVSNGGAPRPPAPSAAPRRETATNPAQPAEPAQPSAAAPRREPFVARKPELRPEDRIQKQGEGAVPLIQSKPGNRGSLAANISGNNPIILRDKANESAKTLKCAECGAMNYPTEWYCERCGAELASL
jgi:hypothetical protein